MHAVQIVTEPRRREILRLVWDRDRSVGEIAERFDVTLGAVSQHLAILRTAGDVTVSRQGNRRLYRADKEALGDLRAVLESIWSASLDSLVDLIETDHPTASTHEST